jgi:hypothetical protein
VKKRLPVILAAIALAGCTQRGTAPVAQVPASAPARPTLDPEAQAALADSPEIALNPSEPESGSLRVRRRWLYYVRGGAITTVRSASRNMVSDLIQQAGGVAGLNGAFFSDARVAGRGNKMIGPLLTGVGAEFAPVDPSDAPRCVGRPLVVIGPRAIAFAPYALWMGDSEASIRRLMPDATDAFLAGGWLVHNGIPQTEEEIRARCVADAQDYRRRAFMGVDDRGRLILGATDYSIDSARLAKSLEPLHIREAVLLDCGFSTSLVWQGRILVSGHSRKSMPSRPVPHALVIMAPAIGGRT